MVIRKATMEETDKILGHALTVMKEASMGFVIPKKAKAIQFAESFLANGGYYLVYNEDEIIKGWIGLSNVVDYNTDEPIGFLSELYILPKWRKRGIGEKLLCEALLHLKELGYARVQLNVYAGNKARNLYEKYGFRDVSTIMQMDLNESVWY